MQRLQVSYGLWQAVAERVVAAAKALQAPSVACVHAVNVSATQV
jgi:hypothetical protein